MTYAGFRSSFTYLCRRYRQTPPIEFKEDLSELMVGVKRSCTEAAQHGEANLWDGDRPLTWGLYKQFNKWFLQEGTEEGLFAAAFSKMTCVLACRGKSTGQVLMQHLLWADDYLEVPFGHMKDAQTGDNAIKKLPRSMYCNPLDHSCCVLVGIFDYLALNPHLLRNPNDPLFAGSVASQSQRFGRYVKQICLKYEQEILKKFGFKISDIGAHSWRKCAHTKLNCGSTAGPTAGVSAVGIPWAQTKTCTLPTRKRQTTTVDAYSLVSQSTRLSLPFRTQTSLPSMIWKV